MKIEIFTSSETKPDLISKIIMKVMGVPYSHIGCIVDGKTIYHSVGGGVCEVSVDEFLKDHNLEDRVDVTHLIKDKGYALGWLHGNMGKDYSETQYIGFIFPFLRKYSADGRRELICSEYVSYFLEDCAGLKIDGVADFKTPKDILDFLKGFL